MNKEEFIDVSKRMVVEYFNRFAISKKEQMIITKDVRLFKYYENEKILRAELIVISLDSTIYEVIYDKNTKHISSNTYNR